MVEKKPNLAEIAEMDKRQLIILWQKIFGSPPVFVGSKEFLQHMIAEQLQGNIPSSLRRKLDKLESSYKKNQSFTSTRLTSGTMIVKEWHGQRHNVTVMDNGFIFNGKTYASLTKIARDITGTAWNGPAFFGLRQ